MKRFSEEDAQNELVKLHGNKIVMFNYYSLRSNANFKCLICGYEWETKPFSILRKETGCRQCDAKSRQISIEDANKRLYKIHGDNISLLSYENISSKATFRCNVCGNIWDVSAYSIINSEQGCRKCSYETIGRRGSESNFWRGGLTTFRKFIRPYLKEWRNSTSRFYNNECVVTGDESQDIHHLYPLNKIIKESLISLGLEKYQFIGNYHLDNIEIICEKIRENHYKYGLGVCLRRDIHILFHKLYGKEDCTPEDFYEFVQRIKSGEIVIE